ncbi:MAG: nucleoside deaminase [Rickettsiales bacterium]
MEAALEEARRAEDAGEIPVGAVVVSSAGKEIARGHNATRTGRDPSAHAEIVALRRACAFLKSDRLPYCDIYVTLEPCPMCAQALSFARIRRVYFGAYDVKGGGTESGAQIFRQKTCFHVPEVYGGLLEKKCAAALSTFFRERRRRQRGSITT